MDILGYLSKNLSIQKSQLLKFISSSPYRYKKYEIPKRNGKGNRTIAQPSKELKFLQRSVCNRFLNDLPIHSAATAYRKGASIRDNVRVHSGARYLLKMDFKDFFPSIRPDDLIDHIIKYKQADLPAEDRFVLEKLFFFGRVRGSPLELSIGSPTSPTISNTVMYDFDEAISSICEKHNTSYTRYADDIALSTNRKGELFDFPCLFNEVINKLAYPRLRFNPEKTVFLSRKDNIHVTGLVLTPDGDISIGRNKKRYIKSLVHKYTEGQLEDSEIVYLRGYLSFCHDVEPAFIERLRRKHGTEALHMLVGRIG